MFIIDSSAQRPCARESGRRRTMKEKCGKLFFIWLILCASATYSWSEGEILEFTCKSCGYRGQFVQGSSADDQARNIQHIIVVCERNGQIRSIRIPLKPDIPVTGEPLLARQYGTGFSELLSMRLPRFLVPGNTCPLFPITAYIERNVCPVNGHPGLQYAVVSQF